MLTAPMGGRESWRKVPTGPVTYSWAIAIRLPPGCRGRRLQVQRRGDCPCVLAHTQVIVVEAVAGGHVTAGALSRPGTSERAAQHGVPVRASGTTR